MSDAQRSQKLVLRLSPEEMEAVERAAGLDGFTAADVAVWARRMIVERAVARSGECGPPVLLAEVTPPAPEPKPSLGLGPCRCDYTSDPAGECDGSCIMRY
jgi:hypothetical protein